MSLRLNDYRCLTCGSKVEVIADPEEQQMCECGGAMERLMPLVRVNMGMPAAGYYDETLGTYIRTRRHRDQVMREQGVTPKGDTPKPDGQAWV